MDHARWLPAPFAPRLWAGRIRTVPARWVAALLLLIVTCLCASTAIAQQDKPDQDQLIPALKAGKLDEVSAAMGRAHATYEHDRRTENEFHKLAYEFYRGDPEIAEPLDGWVSQRPDDPYAYLARGIYRLKMGWLSRGGKFAAQTSAGQFRDLAAWRALSMGDLDKAAQLMPRLVEAYCYLIEADQTAGGRRIQRLFDQAIKVNPDSFIAREFYLHTLTPRWGGSYEAMARFNETFRGDYGRMPELRALEGRIAADRAELLANADRNVEAQALFMEALSKGDFWFTNQSYGELLFNLGDASGAREQFTKVIRHKPGFKRAWWFRALAHRNLKLYAEALADIDRALEIEPRDDAVLAARAGIHLMGKRLDLALNDYEAAATMNPAKPSHQEMVAKIKAALSGDSASGSGR
jgi:tetratricopeptide (TPR) repeat protein